MAVGEASGRVRVRAERSAETVGAVEEGEVDMMDGCEYGWMIHQLHNKRICRRPK